MTARRERSIMRERGYLSTSEAAEYMGITVAALSQRVQRDRAPRSSIILGRRYFTQTDIDAWINTEINQETQP